MVQVQIQLILDGGKLSAHSSIVDTFGNFGFIYLALISIFVLLILIYIRSNRLMVFSILAIIFLDIFLLGTIYQGIDFQTRVINSPTVKYPYECRDVLTYNSSIEDFNNYLYGSGYNYDLKYQEIRNLEVDERCNLISEKISLIRKEINIDDLKKRDQQLYDNEYSLNNQISYLKANYNTILFEKMSNQDSDKSIIKIENIQVASPMQKSDKPIIKDNITSENIKQKYDLLNKEIEKLSKEKENLKLEIWYMNYLNMNIFLSLGCFLFWISNS